jgi:hypothetical protein
MGLSTGTQTACYVRGARGADASFPGGALTFQGATTAGIFLIEVINCA